MTIQRNMKFLTFALVFSLLVSCGPNETTDRPAISPTPQTNTEDLLQDQTPTDLDTAKTTLITFFSYLSEGEYSQAVELYGWPPDQFEALRNNNPTVDPEDKVGLFEAGCTYQYLCLAVKDVVEAEQISATEFHFVVQFANPDDSLFVLGPCCGADETEMPPVSEFDYQVVKMDDHFLVMGSLLYVP